MKTKDAALEEALGQALPAMDWKARMSEGVLIDLKIKRWRARKKLTLTELGVYPTGEARQAYETLLSLGTKLLLPLEQHRELDVIERSARMHLKNWAYDTPFGYFVPFTSYTFWRTGNEEYKRRFLEKRDEIVANYSQLVEQLLIEYDKIARHTYTLLLQQAPEALAQFPNVEAFITHFREEIILKNIKSAEEFAASFVYEEQLSRMPLLTTLESEETKDPEVIQEIQRREQEEAAEAQRQAMMEAMNRDLVDQARRQKRQYIDAFFTSIVAQLRSLIYDAVTNVLASMQEQETLQGRPVIQLRNLIEQIRSLNFYGDGDVDQVIERLQAIIEQPARERNIADIMRQLRAIATTTRGTLLALGEQPRTEREIDPAAIGIPVEPSDEDLRDAREEMYHPVHVVSHDESREERLDEGTPLAMPLSEDMRVESEA
jgi:Protein of unknown function (DUF3150)